uniref:Expansin n=1 Tax=Heterodera avenae TaxID=34510 RepID=J7JLW4_HETAV|nr:expansin B1 [Heterodera avenae]AFQ55679.1 expansin [Heterodera avenae]
MHAFLSLFGIVLATQFNAHIVLADVTATLKTMSAWPGGGQYHVQLKNNDGSKTVCSVKFLLTPKDGTSISANWGMEPVPGAANQFNLANADIKPGATNENGGINVQGDGAPTVQLIETKFFENGFCGGAGGAAGTGGSCMGCLSDTNTDGPINQILNKPVPNSIFTFYGDPAGRGACGLETGVPKMSAAASGNLFSPSGQWKDACREDKQYMLDDPICKNICIKIDYKGKTLTVPINNKCPECPQNHVDLSTSAFIFLEPGGGTVGIARDATLTYMKCPANITTC